MTDYHDCATLPDTPGTHTQYAVAFTDRRGPHRIVMPNNTVECRQAHLDYLAQECGITGTAEQRTVTCGPWEKL